MDDEREAIVADVGWYETVVVPIVGAVLVVRSKQCDTCHARTTVSISTALCRMIDAQR